MSLRGKLWRHSGYWKNPPTTVKSAPYWREKGDYYWLDSKTNVLWLVQRRWA